MDGREKLMGLEFRELQPPEIEMEIWRGITEDPPHERVFLEFDLSRRTVTSYLLNTQGEVENVALTLADIDAIRTRMRDLGWDKD